jgi:hypothetical protein
MWLPIVRTSRKIKMMFNDDILALVILVPVCNSLSDEDNAMIAEIARTGSMTTMEDACFPDDVDEA